MDPTDRDTLRKKLIEARLALTDRLERAVELQSALRVWLVGRPERSIGAYWPIKGEFDPLPALYRWTEGAPDQIHRRIGLPVAHRETKSLRFHVWYPGCPTELDAYDIPKPKDTEEFVPEILVVPCLGFGPGGVRLGPRLQTRCRRANAHFAGEGACYKGFVLTLKVLRENESKKLNH